MERLLDFVERRSRWILVGTVVLTVLAAQRLGEVRYDDDVTAFLPEGDPEVGRFWKIGEMFGGLNVAIVGLEVEDGKGDLFTTERIRALVELTHRLPNVKGVRSVSSLASQPDIRERTLPSGEKEYVVVDLIPSIPETTPELDTLRKNVLGAVHLVGGLVSEDGRAALVLCHLNDRESPLDTAARIREDVAKVGLASLGFRTHLGGAPFISEGLARAAEEDLEVIGPLVALAILLVVLLSFRNLVAAWMSILPVVVAIICTVGLMAALGDALTLVSSALPVILLALGSAYPMHVVARCYTVARERGGHDRHSVREALLRVGPPVFVAGLTTVLGFLAFQAMNIAPMRNFGLYMALGVAISTVIALVVVPAALLHLQMRLPKTPQVLADRMVARIQGAVVWLQARRRTVFLVLAIAVVPAAIGVALIRTDMSTGSYFSRETDTVRADRFLEKRFGGSLYLQLLVEGDIRDPLVLEEIARLEDHARATPGVSDVRSVTEVIRIANRSLFGVDAIPRTRGEVGSLAKLVEHVPDVRLLVTEDWDAALIQVRLGGFDTAEADRMIAALRGYIARNIPESIARVAWSVARSPAAVGDTVLRRAGANLETVLYATTSHDPARQARIVDALRTGLTATGYLESRSFRSALTSQLRRDLLDEVMIELAGEGGEQDLPGVAEAILAEMARGPLDAEAAAAILLARASEAEREDALASRARSPDQPSAFDKAAAAIHRGLLELQAGEIQTAILVALEAVTRDAKPGWSHPMRKARARRIALALTDDVAFLPAAVPAAAGVAIEREATARVAVSGYPVLWAGMNASVQSNQLRSVAISVPVSFLLLVFLFRSFRAGLAAMLPTAITVLAAFGLLGLTGTPMDMGSAMVSSIAMGVGVDYAIHYIWTYRRLLGQGRDAAAIGALEATGPSIVVNALEVGLGFGLLTFGTVAPMSRFGMLTGETMLLAAVATILLLPLLVRNVALAPSPEPEPLAAVEPAAAANHAETG